MLGLIPSSFSYFANKIVTFTLCGIESSHFVTHANPCVPVIQCQKVSLYILSSMLTSNQSYVLQVNEKWYIQCISSHFSAGFIQEQCRKRNIESSRKGQGEIAVDEGQTGILFSSIYSSHGLSAFPMSCILQTR